MEGTIFVSFLGEWRIVVARAAVPECKFRRVRVAKGRTKFLLVEAELPMLSAAEDFKVTEEVFIPGERYSFRLVPDGVLPPKPEVLMITDARQPQDQE
jgi:hypothetical protein